MSIFAKKLTYTYMPGSAYQSQALKNVSFTIHDGEFVAIIGHTGSGKSTLVQCLNGLLRPTSGELTVQGIAVQPKVGLRELRQKVGLVFQYPEYQLFEETVVRDIAFGPENLGLSQDEVRARVDSAMALVGLDKAAVGERSPFELSGGQRRRVAMAGVLAMEPEVLILDEPSAGLDPRGRNDMLRVVKQIHQARGCTVLMVSHSMDEVASVAQRVMVINDGILAMDGTVAEIYAQGEKLKSMGLGVPASVQLVMALRQRGIAVPDGLVTNAQLADWICSEVRRA